MPSTFTARNRFELQDKGENDETWGDRENITYQLIEEALDGYLEVAVGGGSNVTLTASNAVSDQSRQRVLKLTGTLTANIDVICPAQEKNYVVWNATSGAFQITFKPSGGTGLVIPQGYLGRVFTTGSVMHQAAPWMATSGHLFLGDNKRIILDADGDSYITSDDDDVIRFYIGGIIRAELRYATGANEPFWGLRWDDSTAIPGPLSNLMRLSDSPAANDQLGTRQWGARNAALTELTFADIRGRLIDPTTGAERGGLEVNCRQSGLLTTLYKLHDDKFVVEVPIELLTSRLVTRAGTPEAAETAPVGSFAMRSDGVAGSTGYLKESGAGNTGWNAIRTDGSTFESSEQTINAGTLIEVPHGLSARSRKVWGVLRCKIAEFGYEVDDEVELPDHEASNNNTMVGADATNVFIIIGNANIRVLEKVGSPGITRNITPASWRIVLRWEA